MVIWKYPLDDIEEQKLLTAGRGAWNPIHVGYQDGRLTLWAEVDPVGGVLVSRTVTIVGTGHSFDSQGMVHVGSALDPNEPLVWHVYMEEE